MKIEFIQKDYNDNIIDESTTEISEGDTLIATYYPIRDNVPPSVELLHKIMDKLKESLENNSKLIALPWWIKLSVLKK